MKINHLSSRWSIPSIQVKKKGERDKSRYRNIFQYVEGAEYLLKCPKLCNVDENCGVKIQGRKDCSLVTGEKKLMVMFELQTGDLRIFW